MPDTAYDVVDYPDYPYEQTQPARLAAMAALHGLRAPDPATARVLELGCGSGGNLLAIAMAWPDSEVVGLDIASKPVAAATETAAAAGLANATFLAADVRDDLPALGT